ncbi:hypothetical protein LOAG_17689 [Loa loa]|uniref:Uncharacterized protein n=1 Tax=Loa loa TaxID=7209 RepID=A0A1S0UHU9_LOALO|nr:hypothetical protein LOAG_17689 [Loa loa]EJD75113.1 hypothetical protein LOAG_17689 [Loa loa]
MMHEKSLEALGKHNLQFLDRHIGRNKCLPVIFYFAVTRKNVKINYKNACPAAKLSAEIFSYQLMEIGSRVVPVDLTSGRILLPRNFCDLVTSKEELF